MQKRSVIYADMPPDSCVKSWQTIQEDKKWWHTLSTYRYAKRAIQQQHWIALFR